MRTDLSSFEREHHATGDRLLIVEASDDFGWQIKILNSTRELVYAHSIQSCERANEIAEDYSLISDGEVIVRLAKGSNCTNLGFLFCKHLITKESLLGIYY